MSSTVTKRLIQVGSNGLVCLVCALIYPDASMCIVKVKLSYGRVQGKSNATKQTEKDKSPLKRTA